MSKRGRKEESTGSTGTAQSDDWASITSERERSEGGSAFVRSKKWKGNSRILKEPVEKEREGRSLQGKRESNLEDRACAGERGGGNPGRSEVDCDLRKGSDQRGRRSIAAGEKVRGESGERQRLSGSGRRLLVKRTETTSRRGGGGCVGLWGRGEKLCPPD